MKEVSISLELQLPDDVAEKVQVMDKATLVSDITYFLIQKTKGGYVITNEQLDEIVDNILDMDDDDNVSTGLSAEQLEELVGNAVTKALSNVSVSQSAVVNASTVVEEPEEEDLTPQEILSFNTGGSDEDNFDDSALDDLADMFGFG